MIYVEEESWNINWKVDATWEDVMEFYKNRQKELENKNVSNSD